MVLSSKFSLEDYCKVTDHITNACSFDDIQKYILGPLSKIIGAETAVFTIARENNHKVTTQKCITQNFDVKYMDIYENKFHAHDPMLPYAFYNTQLQHRLIGAKSFAITLDNIIDPEMFFQGSYYNEFLRPSLVQHVLAMGIPDPLDNSMIYLIGLQRYSTTPFNDEDSKTLEMIGPVLYKTFQGMHLKEKTDEQGLIISELDRGLSDNGLIILDENYNITYADLTAKKHLNLSFQAFKDNLSAKLLNFSSQALNKNGNENETSFKSTFKYNDVYIEAEAKDFFNNARSNRIILKTRKACPSSISISAREAFGLSKRELEITRHLIKGATSPDISKTLSISVRTVENHLRSIFGKVGIHNRTSLAYKMSKFDLDLLRKNGE